MGFYRGEGSLANSVYIIVDSTSKSDLKSEKLRMKS